MNASSRPSNAAANAVARVAAGVVLVLTCPLLVLVAPRSEAVAVVGSPTGSVSDVARIVVAAGGDIVQMGAADSIIVARSKEPGFVLRLYAAGAWLVLDPIVATLCSAEAPARRVPPSSKAEANVPS